MPLRLMCTVRSTGRAGARKYSADRKRILVVRKKARIRQSMRYDDLPADIVSKLLGNLCTNDCIGRCGERTPFQERQRPSIGIPVMIEIAEVRSEDPIAAVRISQGNRNGPVHLRSGADFLVAAPCDVVRRVADTKNRIQEQVQIAATRADNQVGAGDRVGKARLRVCSDPVHNGEQGRAHGNRCNGQGGRRTPVHQALEDERQCVADVMQHLNGAPRRWSAEDRSRRQSVSRAKHHD